MEVDEGKLRNARERGKDERKRSNRGIKLRKCGSKEEGKVRESRREEGRTW